jgi:hypothetical protein
MGWDPTRKLDFLTRIFLSDIALISTGAAPQNQGYQNSSGSSLPLEYITLQWGLSGRFQDMTA